MVTNFKNNATFTHTNVTKDRDIEIKQTDMQDVICYGKEYYTVRNSGHYFNQEAVFYDQLKLSLVLSRQLFIKMCTVVSIHQIS